MIRHPRGMTGFTIVWLGQIISVTATYMTSFVLGVWVFEETKSLTAFGLTEAFYIVPLVLILPVAGVVVDRYNRKAIMILSDMLAWIATSVILYLQLTGSLQVWHLYIAAIFQGIGNAFQWPAYSAAISNMVEKKQLVRANSMMFLMDDGPSIIAPALGVTLLSITAVGLTGVLVIDVLSFVVAICTLLIVDIPQPPTTIEGMKAQGGFFKEIIFGFRYIRDRRSLLGLQIIFFFGNLFSGMGIWALYALVLTRAYSVPPALLNFIASVENYFMIFSSTAINIKMLALLQSSAALATVIGGVILSAIGGFKYRIHGVLIGWIISSFGLMFLGLGRGVLVWTIAIIIYALMEPLVNTANLAIWQSKVAPDLQGRVFSFQQQMSWATVPVAPIFAGLLGDKFFEPAMQTTGTLSTLFGWLVGTGPGSGFALVIILSGVATAIVGAWGYFVPAVRNVERSLPDPPTIPRPLV